MSYLHDATPTWNGFNYQGKIALLTVLDKLIELKALNEEIQGYNLELEWLEDFSIKKHDEYISIHQVKNYGDDNKLNSYDEAILSLLCKSLKAVTPSELTKIITQKGISKEDKLKIATSIYEKLEEDKIIVSNVVFTTDDLLQNFKFEQETEEKFNEPDNVLKRLKDILKHYKQIADNCNNLESSYLHVAEKIEGFTKDNIKAIEIIKNSEISNNQNFESEIDNVKLYKYDDDVFNCTNDDIQNILNNRLKKLIALIDQNGDPYYYKIQDSYINKTICILLSIIDKNVTDRHQAIRNKSNTEIETIDFEAFVATINANHDQSNSYDAFLLKEIYTKSLEEFLKENSGNNDVCEFLTNVSNHNMTNFEGVKFIEFCNQISPHALNFDKKSTLLEEGGLRNSFFEFFSKSVIHNKFDICLKDSNNESCVITTIHEGNFETPRQSSLYSRIKKNSKSIPYNFNVESFAGSIGGKGNGGLKFSDVIPNATKAPEQYIGKNNAEKITISENFKIIDINDLIDKLQ